MRAALPESAKLPAAGDAVLVAALNWGLGHAARCVPLIQALHARGCRVHLASDGAALAFWRGELPGLPVHELPGWGIRYAPGPWLLPGLAVSLPRIWRALREEAAQAAEIVRRHGISWILSDNRYGVHVPGVPAVLLSHQPHPALPRPLRVLEPFVESAMARLCRPFDEVWVPDGAAFPGLSGRLGHPLRPRSFPPLRYLGPLSRFEPFLTETVWDTVAVVSGPEPARGDFEARLRRELSVFPGRHLLVCGRPDLPGRRERVGNLEAVPHLPTKELEAALAGAAVVISRGGYSTLMDLAVLGNVRALVVPTPGQTEQEALAHELAASGLAHAAAQESLDLSRDLSIAFSIGPLRIPDPRTK
jgi:hypothetical protein